MPYQTILFVAIAAVFVIGFLYWRSKREERQIRERTMRQRPSTDVLISEGQADEADAKSGAAQVAATAPIVDSGVLANAAAVSPLPPMVSGATPVRAPVARSSEEPKAKLEVKNTQQEPKTVADVKLTGGYDVPPIEPSIEWVLDVQAKDGQEFALGMVRALEIELKKIQLPLWMRIWCQSTLDNRYYLVDKLNCPARRIRVSVVLCNRSHTLDEVKANQLYQAIEQLATQNDVEVRRNLEPEAAVKDSISFKRAVDYYSLAQTLVLKSRAERGLEVDVVKKVAATAGFTQEAGGWAYRVLPNDRDALMTLQFGANNQSMRLALDVPLADVGRGDLNRFFTLANHLANHLACTVTDEAGRPLNAGMAVMMDVRVREHAEQMASQMVSAGSNRAKLLFAKKVPGVA